MYKAWTGGKVDELVVKQVVVKSKFELDFKSLSLFRFKLPTCWSFHLNYGTMGE